MLQTLTGYIIHSFTEWRGRREKILRDCSHPIKAMSLLPSRWRRNKRRKTIKRYPIMKVQPRYQIPKTGTIPHRWKAPVEAEREQIDRLISQEITAMEKYNANTIMHHAKLLSAQ